MMKKLFAAFGALLLCALAVGAQNFPGASGNPSVLSRPGGTFYAPAYFWQGRVLSGNTATGSQSIIITGTSGGTGGLQLADGTTIPLQVVFSTTLSPLIVDWGQGNAEYVTPTAVSVGTCPSGNLGVGGSTQCATITASFANTHGQSAVVVDGTFGLQTAINYAASLNAQTSNVGNVPYGGGMVTVDAAWGQMAQSISSVTGGPAGGANGLIAAAIPFPSVVIRDDRGTRAQYYSVQPSNATAIATGPVLTSGSAFSGTAATLGGTSATWTASAVYICVTYVDIQGHEGPCGPTYNFTATASVVLQVNAPAASAGTVGYLVYAGSSYAAATRLPVVSGTTGGPTCTLTSVETVTPACAVTNSTYNQTGSNATFALIYASTQPQPPGATITTFTTLQAFDITHTGYAYLPTNITAPGFTADSVSFAASTGTSASKWELGRALIPVGYMNQIGKTIRVSGLITGTGNTVPTPAITIAMGPPWTSSAGVSVCQMADTTAWTAAVYNTHFECTITTQTVSVAAGTGGTVLSDGYMLSQLAGGTTAGAAATDSIVAAATVNLYGADEIEVIFTPTSSTGVTSPQLLQLSVVPMN